MFTEVGLVADVVEDPKRPVFVFFWAFPKSRAELAVEAPKPDAVFSVPEPNRNDGAGLLDWAPNMVMMDVFFRVLMC